MKTPIFFRAMTRADFELFTKATSYWPGTQFNGIVAYSPTAIMGMVGFDSWTPRTVMAHWMIRYPRCIEPLWSECIAYIRSTGRTAMLGATPSDNEKALKAIRHLGWNELYRIKNAWDIGVDIVISEYLIHGTATDSTVAVRRAGRNGSLTGNAPDDRGNGKSDGRRINAARRATATAARSTTGHGTAAGDATARDGATARPTHAAATANANGTGSSPARKRSAAKALKVSL
jgi:hypothetical protein